VRAVLASIFARRAEPDELPNKLVEI